MEKDEVLDKVKKKKPAVIGEMESSKINKGNWIAVISAGALAVVLMIVEGAMGHYSAIFAISAICYLWASILYVCQYVLAKRPWQVLIGAVLHGLACLAMIALYIVSLVQAW